MVYASPNYARRTQLWDDLAHLADSIHLPWVILGDFNVILTDAERKGGSNNPSPRGRQDFQNMIQGCELIDAGFQGSPFTWRKGYLHQRLDRVLINMQWRLRFPQASVLYLPYFKSAHRAILVKMNNQRSPNRHRRPFRFTAS